MPTRTPDASREPCPAAIFLPCHFSLASTQQIASISRGEIPAAPPNAAAAAGVVTQDTACTRRTPPSRQATHLTSASDRRIMCAKIARAMTTITKESAPPKDLRDPHHHRPHNARQKRNAATHRLPGSILDAWGAVAPGEGFQKASEATVAQHRLPFPNYCRRPELRLPRRTPPLDARPAVACPCAGGAPARVWAGAGERQSHAFAGGLQPMPVAQYPQAHGGNVPTPGDPSPWAPAWV